MIRSWVANREGVTYQRSGLTRTRSSILVLLGLAICLVSCNNPAPTSNPQPLTPGGGVSLQTIYYALGIQTAAGGVFFQLKYVGDDGNFGNFYPNGSTNQVYTFTNSSGSYSNTTTRTPADWTFNWTSLGAFPNCSKAPDNGATIFLYPPAVGVNAIGCYDPPSDGTTSTYDLDINSGPEHVTFEPLTEPYPPTKLTVSGSGFDSTYGMPVVQVYDAYGNLLVQTTATSATATSLSISSIAMSATDYGTWYGFVLNVDSQHQLSAVGAGTFKMICSLPKGEACP